MEVRKYIRLVGGRWLNIKCALNYRMQTALATHNIDSDGINPLGVASIIKSALFYWFTSVMTNNRSTLLAYCTLVVETSQKQNRSTVLTHKPRNNSRCPSPRSQPKNWMTDFLAVSSLVPRHICQDSTSK